MAVSTVIGVVMLFKCAVIFAENQGACDQFPVCPHLICEERECNGTKRCTLLDYGGNRCTRCPHCIETPPQATAEKLVSCRHHPRCLTVKCPDQQCKNPRCKVFQEMGINGNEMTCTACAQCPNLSGGEPKK